MIPGPGGAPGESGRPLIFKVEEEGNSPLTGVIGSEVGLGWVGFGFIVGMLLAEREVGTVIDGKVVFVVGGEVTVDMSKGSFTALEIADSEASEIAKSLRIVPAGGGPTVRREGGGDEATAATDDVVGSETGPDAIFGLLEAEGEG